MTGALLLGVAKSTYHVIISGVYADGPGAYLFHGVFEQPYVFHVMDHALCLSNSKQESCAKHVARGGKAPVTTSKPPVINGGYTFCVSSFNSLIILASWIILLF